jgi:homoserine O-acetyltransferase
MREFVKRVGGVAGFHQRREPLVVKRHGRRHGRRLFGRRGAASPDTTAKAATPVSAADANVSLRVWCDEEREPSRLCSGTESIYDYSPEADLSKIRAHVMLINNVEDFADPPTLGTVERAFKTIEHGTYVLTPYGKDTHGHFTHYYAATWKPYLVKFMSGLPPPLKVAR